MEKTNLEYSKNIFLKKNSNWVWFKIGLVSVFVLVFGFSLNSYAGEKSLEDDGYVCQFEAIEEHVRFINKGIKSLNTSSEERVFGAVWDLVFSLEESQVGCPVILEIEEVEKMKRLLDYENLNLEEKVEFLNAKISLLNETDIYDPIMYVRYSPEIIPESARCDARKQALFDLIGEEFEKTSTGKIGDKGILFLKQLSKEFDINFPNNAGEEWLKDLAAENDCEFKVVKTYTNKIETESKEYLCEDGEIVKDKLLCPLK